MERITASLSTFVEWFPLRFNEPYCEIALLPYLILKAMRRQEEKKGGTVGDRCPALLKTNGILRSEADQNLLRAWAEP
jgi:hypothetical protein